MMNSSSLNILNLINIEKLNGNNFRTWKQQIDLNLGLLEFAIAFKQPKPHALTSESTKDQKDAFEKWARANEMSLLIMQNAMEEHIRGGVPSCDLAKDYLAAIEEKYKRSDKVETGSYLTALTSAKFDGGSIREHLLKLVNVGNKLNTLDVPISEQFLVHMALNSLTAEYEQVKINYNTQKESWTVNELIAICCQEEDRLKKGKEEAVNFVNGGKGKKAFAFNKSGNTGNVQIKSAKFKPGSSSGTKKGAFNSGGLAKNIPSSNNSGLKVNKDFVKKCHFCQSTEHLRRDCAGFKAWLIKKGIQKPEGTK
ncbi:uncharacterized protein [Malus domestica]|uniref:uncharacterized protein n=1 Tax=Malus domestica TaxID=3750 RepID=UPI0010AA9D8E|nr:uncharacterized protein LOC114819669 [Malus domestica]